FPCESGAENPAKPALTPQTNMPRCLTVSRVAAVAVETETASKAVMLMSLFIGFLLLLTDAFQCLVHGAAESIDDHVDVVRRRNVGRREQHMVAAAAIRGPAGRITAEA